MNSVLRNILGVLADIIGVASILVKADSKWWVNLIVGILGLLLAVVLIVPICQSNSYKIKDWVYKDSKITSVYITRKCGLQNGMLVSIYYKDEKRSESAVAVGFVLNHNKGDTEIQIQEKVFLKPDLFADLIAYKTGHKKFYVVPWITMMEIDDQNEIKESRNVVS